MRLGIMLGYSGAKLELPLEIVQEADRLGYYAVWAAEAYGSDSVTPLAWVGALTQQIRLGTAIMQMPARTPAMTAMTAITLDQLSGGRMLLGLGLSGPQVVEGWHGQPYGKPLGKTREYVKIVRTILEREKPLEHDGTHYQVPYHGDDATGLGKPLKSIIHGRPDLPIYLASIGPKNVQLTAEIADGWLPIFFAPDRYDETYKAHIDAGLAKAGNNKTLDDLQIAPSVTVVLGDDIAECRAQVKPMLALYIGGMGAKGKNFYHDAVTRYGYGDAADKIQELYLQGKKAEATDAVPDALVDEVAFCGPKERIAELLPQWEKSPATTLNLTTWNPEAVRVMAELVLGVDPTQHTSVPASMGETENNTVQDTERNIEMSEFKSDVMFQGMGERIAANSGLVQSVDAVFQFNIAGPSDKSWVVDLKNGDGSVYEGESDAADCTISISDDNFVDLANGNLNPTTAFMSGKIKVKGNPMLATKLQQIMS